MQIDHIVEAMRKKGSLMKGGIVCDEIEIRAGLVYLASSGKIIGTATEPILEKEVSKVRVVELEMS